jgi:hypothetical protein
MRYVLYSGVENNNPSEVHCQSMLATSQLACELLVSRQFLFLRREPEVTYEHFVAAAKYHKLQILTLELTTTLGNIV